MEVIGPGEPGHGQYYQTYCQQWMQWLVSNNPEANNYGPVRFLHCVPPCQQENSSFGNISYGTQPIVRIGTQAININAGNYVFLPIITSAVETVDNNVPDDPATLLNYVRTDLEEGDDPPHRSQATIVDATNIDPNKSTPVPMDPIVNGPLDRFLVITDVFPLDVPRVQPGSRLLRTCFDVPINTEGVRNCRVGGYWILMRFTKGGMKYYVRSSSRGRASYQSGMLYEINVSDFNRPRPLPGRPDMTNKQIKKIVQKLNQDGLIDPRDEKIIGRILP